MLKYYSFTWNNHNTLKIEKRELLFFGLNKEKIDFLNIFDNIERG